MIRLDPRERPAEPIAGAGARERGIAARLSIVVEYPRRSGRS